jgi:hypothetical protein
MGSDQNYGRAGGVGTEIGAYQLDLAHGQRRRGNDAVDARIGENIVVCGLRACPGHGQA